MNALSLNTNTSISLFCLQVQTNGSKVYTECSCVKPKFTRSSAYLFTNSTLTYTTEIPFETTEPDMSAILGTATPGACSVDCMHKFYVFLAVVCLLKFSGATGRASNFLVSVRCVDEKDKTVAMGFGLTIMSLFAFIPSPILFGFILGKNFYQRKEYSFTCSSALYS